MTQRESRRRWGGPEAGSISESNQRRCSAGPGGRLQLFPQLTAAAALCNKAWKSDGGRERVRAWGGVHLLGARSEMEGRRPSEAGALVKARFLHE